MLSIPLFEQYTEACRQNVGEPRRNYLPYSYANDPFDCTNDALLQLLRFQTSALIAIVHFSYMNSCNII